MQRGTTRVMQEPEWSRVWERAGEKVHVDHIVIFKIYRTHVARCHDPLVDASELGGEVHVETDWGPDADGEGGAGAGV